MEIWKAFNDIIIPIDTYTSILNNDEENQLLIHLEGKKNRIKLDFGPVMAMRVLNESILLNDNLFCDEVIKEYKKTNFSEVLYRVYDGEFERTIKTSCNELYDFFELKHFIVVTLNYIIDIITSCEPQVLI